MTFTIASKAPMLFGVGSVEQTGLKATEFGWSKVILVYDKGVKSVGIVDRVHKSLEGAGISWVGYDGVLPDPTDIIAEKAAEVARKENVNGVIGIGGGSPLDVAKAVSILLSNPSPVSQYFGQDTVPNKPDGAILIPTTAGTGSEVSHVAMIADSANKVKAAIVGEYSKAKLAIVDPELTYRLPANLTAQTALDTFAHGFEAYTGLGNNPVSDLYAEKAMRLVVDNLPLTLADPANAEARSALSLAASIGGMAFGDSLTHMGHNFAQSVGTLTKAAHGITCVLGTLSSIEFFADVIPDRISSVGQLFGLDANISRSYEELGHEVAERYKTFITSCGLPSRWSEIGATEDMLPEAARLIVAEPILTLFAPKQITEEIALALLRKYY